MTNDALNTPQAAARLGVSASFVAKARMSGGGPTFYKVGRRVIYKAADLDAWLEARGRKSTSEAGAT